MPMPALDPASPAAAEHHLLVLPADVGPDEVELLARSRFPHAAWETSPTAAPSRPTGGSRRSRTAEPAPGVLRLSRHSTLEGPYSLDLAATAALGLPRSAGLAYVARAPVERGERPWSAGDRDGLGRAFPDGLPVRAEERTLRWLVAAARRLGGAVRAVARAADARPTLLVPEPAAAVDLTVWSDVWLEPDAALAVMRRAVPRAELNLPAEGWAGPPSGTGNRPVPGTEEMDPVDRAALHLVADDADVRALTAPKPMQAYGALVDLDDDGTVALQISGETALPPVVADLPWADGGAIAYRVSWTPVDLADLETERASVEHRLVRARVTPLVVAVTRQVHAAVGGEITDMMDFAVDPAYL